MLRYYPYCFNHEKETIEYYGFGSCDVNYGKVISYSYSNGIFDSRYINVKGDNPCSKLYGKALGIIGKIFFLFLRVKYYQLQLYSCLFIFDDNTLLSQKRTLKTRNSKRYVPLPDFIMDELYLARARYEETLKNDPEFDENLDFVLFRDHGKAIARPYYYFKKLMKKCNIDCTKHVWHDLRHTYATLLDQNNMNMKVVSEILGHYSEEFTNEVYVIHKPEVIIYDTSEVMNSFIESLKLDSTERTIPVYDISFIQEYLF